MSVVWLTNMDEVYTPEARVIFACMRCGHAFSMTAAADGAVECTYDGKSFSHLCNGNINYQIGQDVRRIAVIHLKK